MNRPDGRLAYDLSVTAGLLSITGGVYLKAGADCALITGGVLLIALAVYAAERLQGR